MINGRTLFQLARLSLLAGALSPIAAARAETPPAASPARQQADQLATQIVAKMTLEEKLGQLVNVAPAIPRLKIPAYN